MLKDGSMFHSASRGLGKLALGGGSWLAKVGVLFVTLMAGEAQAEPQAFGSLSRTGFSVGSCQVASMEVTYHFQVTFDPQAGASVAYWEPAGEDCELSGNLMLQVEHGGATKWVRVNDTYKRKPRQR